MIHSTSASKGHSPLVNSNDFAELTFRRSAELIGETQRVEENLGVAREHRTVFLSHGHRTPKSFLLYNGLNRTTEELRELGESCAKVGNTIIPNAPLHGRPLGHGAIADLTTASLLDFAKTITKVGEALGDQIYNAGVSMGSAISLYGALNSKKVNRVVAIAPPFGLRGLPDWVLPLVRRALLILPNMEKFPITGEPAPAQSTRATAAVGGLSLAIWKQLTSGRALGLPAQLVVLESKDDALLNAQSTRRVCKVLAAAGTTIDFIEAPEIAMIVHPKDAKTVEQHRHCGRVEDLFRAIYKHVARHFEVD